LIRKKNERFADFIVYYKFLDF